MKLMAKLINHDGIVGIRDAGQGVDRALFIVMDYLRGGSLADFLVKGLPMDKRWIVQFLIVLCGAVQHAHDQGVLHRDLKPANLLFAGAPGEASNLKVSDFGLAKDFGRRFNHRGSTTETGSFLGSPPYTSPEQAEGKPVDERSDIYSIGVILYELLTGHRPFSGSPARMIADTLTTPAPAFAAINPEVRVSIEVERVVLRCLEKDPSARYLTARILLAEFVEAVERASIERANIERANVRGRTRGVRGLLNSAFGLLSGIG
jgi:serine/threonine-protein kinase